LSFRGEAEESAFLFPAQAIPFQQDTQIAQVIAKIHRNSRVKQNTFTKTASPVFAALTSKDSWHVHSLHFAIIDTEIQEAPATRQGFCFRAGSLLSGEHYQAMPQIELEEWAEGHAFRHATPHPTAPRS
jgi:hypothetical protein